MLKKILLFLLSLFSRAKPAQVEYKNPPFEFPIMFKKGGG